MVMKKFRGCGDTEFNVYVTVKAKNEVNARKIIEKFFDNCQGMLDYTWTFQGKKVEVTFDECFEVMDVIEIK